VIEVRTDFFNNVACAREYFESEVAPLDVETKTFEGFVSDVGHNRILWGGGGLAQNALVLPASPYPTVIIVTSEYEGPDYSDQWLSDLREAGEASVADYFDELSSSGAVSIDTEELLEIFADRYWRQASVAP
jgi:hypothetical protein